MGYTAFAFKELIEIFKINAYICKQNLNNKLFMPHDTEKKISTFAQVIDIPRGYLKNTIGIDATGLLRCISQGHKVCVELVLFLINHDMVQPGDLLLVITGTVIGADTATEVLIKNNKQFKIKKILAMSVN
jgi:hypothetical protein